MGKDRNLILKELPCTGLSQTYQVPLMVGGKVLSHSPGTLFSFLPVTLAKRFEVLLYWTAVWVLLGIPKGFLGRFPYGEISFFVPPPEALFSSGGNLPTGEAISPLKGNFIFSPTPLKNIGGRGSFKRKFLKGAPPTKAA